MYSIYFAIAAVTLVHIPATSAIIGGHDSNITRHKWQLSLQHNNEHFCGAVLISLEWGLTSARCLVIHNTDLTISAGSSNTTGGDIYAVSEVISHPNYDPKTFDSDIALLRFAKAIDTNVTQIFPANLPYSDAAEVPYSPATITGWGSTERGGSYADILQMVQVPVRSRDDCVDAYTINAITDNMFCAGWINVNNCTSCDGDYGGPVIIYARLAGIQSWGRSCGVAKWPSVFTRVANYRQWIKSITGIES